MRFYLLFLFFLWELRGDITIRETALDGSWLEAHLYEDRRLKGLTFSDGSHVHYEGPFLKKIARIDSLGEELYSQHYHWNGSQLESQTGWFTTEYRYDDRGRVVAKLNPWHQETIEYNHQGQAVRIGDRTYSYDSLGQITSEQDYFEALYDENCNLTELNNQSISVNCCNQIIHFLYDERGNQLREKWIYDERNQLLEAGDEHYKYDIYGRRLQKESIYYLYLGFEEIASTEKGYYKTLKVPGIGGPIAIEINGKPYAPITNTQGIIKKLIDPVNYSVYAENHCDVFGGGLTDAIPYAYRGKRYDPKTNLIYFGKRYYDPTWHRWLTQDPLGDIDHENLYQYVYNNPLQYSDPIGCSFWGYMLGLGEVLAGGAIMAGGIGLEVVTLGGFTLGFTVVEGSGLALMTDGLARATRESRDLQIPQWKQKKPDLLWSEPCKKPPRFNGQELGLDPSQCPGDGFEWRGNGPPESGKGNWLNPTTGEKLHPDLKHPPGKDPHWGFTDSNGTPYDLFLDGSWK